MIEQLLRRKRLQHACLVITLLLTGDHCLVRDFFYETFPLRFPDVKIETVGDDDGEDEEVQRKREYPHRVVHLEN